MSDISDKIKLIEITQRLKKGNISFQEALKEIGNLHNKEYLCCDNICIEITDKIAERFNI